MNEKKNLRKSISYKWLKLSFTQGGEPPHVFWITSKKNIPLAVTRNRLKRWGRLFFKERVFKEFKNIEKDKQKKVEKESKKRDIFRGDWMVFFLKEKDSFYKNLKRKDFDYVFKKAFGELFLNTSFNQDTKRKIKYQKISNKT